MGTAFIVKSQSRSKTFQKFSFLALLHNFAINSHDVPYPNLSNLTIIAHGNNFNPVFNLEINTQLTYFILISATDTEGWIIIIFGIVLDILFDIWTIYVAKKAIKEIKDDQKTTSPEPVVLPAQDSNNEQQVGNQAIIGV